MMADGSESDGKGDGAVATSQDNKIAITPAQGKRRRRRRMSSKRLAERNGQVDICAILTEPIEVLKAGKPGKMSTLEAAIRQQAKKALSDKSLPSILAVIRIAIDNHLVAPPPAPFRGGAFIVPKFLTEEEQKRIFTSETDCVVQVIYDILRPYYDEW